MQNAQWWDMLYQLVRNCYRAAAARERFPIDVQQAEFERTSREARGHRLTTRRRWVGTTILAAAAGGVGCFVDTVGRPIGTVPFEGEGRSPLDTLTGDELDGRQFTDLSGLDSGHLVTPTARFYIRTRASHLLDTSRPWSVRVGQQRISLEDLKSQAQPQGVHLMECAGNNRAASFGMIGVALWDGVPLAPLLDRLSFDKSARILVSGFDEYSAKPLTPSVPGASWIFSRQDIDESRAFLATAMNGQPLTPDHGAPVRLVLPGWYGCACSKWVSEIASVDGRAEPTSQMREYAARTHQHGMPELARNYQPATIDLAAMPVRVEKWRVGGKVQYKVIGIVWGGAQPAGKLLIRFGPEEPYVPVTHVNAVQDSWGLWTQNWTPTQPGTYRIGLRLADPSVRTRRLDEGFYVRQVRIEEV
jgi:DMSO/TMAO reductase YedYZ molybdopterin-dependent catalytic subunit